MGTQRSIVQTPLLNAAESYPASRRNRRRGIALVWVAVILLGVIAVVALGLDTGLSVLANQQLQNAADASALAAMNRLRMGGSLADGRTAAVDIARANRVVGTPVQLNRNDANAETGEIVFGWYDRKNATFTARETAVNAAKVVAQRTATAHGGVPLAFGAGFGKSTVDLSREAIAMRGGGTGEGMIVLDLGKRCTLDVRGNVVLTVNDVTKSPPEAGAIQVNTENECGACGSGHPNIEAGTLNVHGGSCLGGALFEGEVNTGAEVLPDPLATLPAPPLGPTRTTTGPVLEPGYYPAGITLTGGLTTLNPGIYVLDGAGFSIGGNAAINAYGVMLYITGTGKFDLGGSAPVNITPPDPTLHNFPGVGTYAGMSVFQDRANPTEARIIGTSGSNLQGTYYFPKNRLELGGTGIAVGNQLIAGEVYCHGTGTFTINYDGRNPGVGRDIFLIR